MLYENSVELDIVSEPGVIVQREKEATYHPAKGTEKLSERGKSGESMKKEIRWRKLNMASTS